jgi:DNA-binding PadR family transcriptional regulator
MKDDLKQFLPLSRATFYILLALSDEDRHGYAIMQEVARQSAGSYKLGPGTLYDNLQNLIEQDLVAQAPRRSSKEDPRRRYYRITPHGRRVFAAEIEHLDSIVRSVKLRLRGANTREATS